MADKDAYRALFKVMGEAMGLTRGQQAQLLQFLDDVGDWHSVPSGGSTDDVLTKSSDVDYDYDWVAAGGP